MKDELMYLLDANTLIEAKNRHYGFDFCPAFWNWLIQQNQQGMVYSVNRVKEEILDGEDELKDWVKITGSQLFLPAVEHIDDAFREINKFLYKNQYEESGISKFQASADYYLIAQALTENTSQILNSNTIVVTQEVSSNSKQKVKIPNVCKALDVECIDPYEMLRAEKARFILP